MRVRTTAAALLLRLPHQQDALAQAATFRQALTALAHATSALGPPPLDGVDPRAVESAAMLAVQRGYLDHLDFIDPGSGAVALYELSAAMPQSQLKRDLRRRVFTLLYKGHAGTFIPVATRIALGRAGPLSAPTLQARVALCLDLPLGSPLNVGPLALALTTRSTTHQRWILDPSTRALPARRTAALLYEHAAREAVFRFQLGDSQPRDALRDRRWGKALTRLLVDREPLVWRHAAVARGLLAAIDPELRQEVELALDPACTVAEWRRAAVSLVTSTVLGDEEAFRSVLSVLAGPIVRRDPGLPAAMVPGLSRVIEMEPDLARRMADQLAHTRRPDVAVAFAELIGRNRGERFAPHARQALAETLLGGGRKQSRVERSLTSRALQVLSGQLNEETDLISRVEQALITFEEQGAEQAYAVAQRAIAEAHEIASFIETTDPLQEETLAAAVASLVELDAGALEGSTLSNLLLLGRPPGDPAASVEPFECLQNRMSRWILDGVERAGEATWTRDGAMADQRRLLVLLHLVDVGSGEESDQERAPIVTRLQRSIRVLLGRLANDPDATVHRVLCAALARSFDAAVREGVTQASDLLLVVAMTLRDNFSVQVIAEASTTPDVAGPLLALSQFMSVEPIEPGESESASLVIDSLFSHSGASAEERRRINKLMALSRGLVGGGGYHAEALRRVFFRLGRSLERVALSHGQSELVEPQESGSPVLDDLSACCEEIAAMVRCSFLRVLGSKTWDLAGVESEVEFPSGLYELVERGLESRQAPGHDEIARAVEAMVTGLPEPLARAVEQVTFRIQRLPLTATNSTDVIPLSQRRAALPGWLLPRRAIGSFHVVRPLGSGGVSSVFLVRRLDERNNPKAEAFALKVPEYDPSTARSMSEQDFFQMFRDEAGALLALPAHENLARFVTFDLSARPKPILVMELIRGTPLDRLVRSRALTMPRVLTYLDGILAGLEAMHGVQVGHLDVKPSNVILREGRTPVLVDFGLSGRILRPGCGTIEYTCPEVLGVVAEGATASPMKADIYAFGCLTFEMLTGRTLFRADDELALVAQHVSHDGWLDDLAVMAQVPHMDRIANLIGSCLRHDPRKRPTANQLRAALTRAILPLTELEWPLSIPSRAQDGVPQLDGAGLSADRRGA